MRGGATVPVWQTLAQCCRSCQGGTCMCTRSPGHVVVISRREDMPHAYGDELPAHQPRRAARGRRALSLSRTHTHAHTRARRCHGAWVAPPPAGAPPQLVDRHDSTCRQLPARQMMRSTRLDAAGACGCVCACNMMSATARAHARAHTHTHTPCSTTVAGVTSMFHHVCVEACMRGTANGAQWLSGVSGATLVVACSL